MRRVTVSDRLDGGESWLRRGTEIERSLDRGVQSRPASRGVQDPTPHEAFLTVEALPNSETVII